MFPDQAQGADGPSFDRGLASGCITAARQPSEIEPIERAQLDLNRTGDVDLRDQSRRQRGHAYFSVAQRGGGNFEAHVVATLIERDDLGIVPLISEPLAVGEAASLGPGKHSPDSPGNMVAFVRLVRANISYASRREIAQPDRKAVRIFPHGQALEPVPFLRWSERCLHRLSFRAPETFGIEFSWRHAIMVAKRTGEIRARRETAGQGDVGESHAFPAGQQID